MNEFFCIVLFFENLFSQESLLLLLVNVHFALNQFSKINIWLENLINSPHQFIKKKKNQAWWPRNSKRIHSKNLFCWIKWDIGLWTRRYQCLVINPAIKSHWFLEHNLELLKKSSNLMIVMFCIDIKSHSFP